MLTWNEFAAARPDLAEVGRARFYQVPVGEGYLATVRPDGAPRIRPICPLLTPDGLFAFIIPSPKQTDLRRDGWYSMHSFPCPDNEDAFYVSGRARLVTDDDVRRSLAAQFVDERSQFSVPSPAAEDALFEFDLDSCLLTKTTGHGDAAPQHRVWQATRE